MRQPDIVEERLVASGQRRTHLFAFRRTVPVGRGGHGSRRRCEADRSNILTVAFPHELSDVPFTAAVHLRGPRIAEVRVVLPDDDLRIDAASPHMLGEGIDRVGHMFVAEVP